MRRICHQSNLSGHDRDLLSRLEATPEYVSCNTTLWREGDDTTQVYIVHRGLAYSFRHLESGNRQIMEIYLPGDLSGLRESVLDLPAAGQRTLTDCWLCSIPRARILEAMHSSLPVSNALLHIALRHQGILLERLVNVGRRPARQRLASLLLEVHARLCQHVPRAADVRIPFTQAFLGDALGLSAVHVSRVFHGLRREGFITREGRLIRLLDPVGMKRIAGFDEGYLLRDVHQQGFGLIPGDCITGTPRDHPGK